MVFKASDSVSKEWFIAVKGYWVDGVGPEGLVYVYAPLDGSERATFFNSLV